MDELCVFLHEFSQYYNNDNKNNEVYSTFKDDSIYKNHEFFQDNRNCIQIQIAYDDYNVENNIHSEN